MKKSTMVLLTVLGVILLEVVVLVALIYSGAYNVSTANHDNGVINWALDRGTTRSITSHAKKIKPPPLSDASKIQDGFMHYDEMCVICHGAPGIEPGEIGKGLWPTAPDLAKAVPEWTPAELFWITKNGVKFTAMPAWGPTHNEDRLWAMVAFLEKLPNLSSAEYKAMKEKSGMK